MYLSEALNSKWSPMLEAEGVPQIRDEYKRACTAVILETCEQTYEQEGGGVLILNEAAPANKSAGYPNSNTYMEGPEPVLIPLLRRAVPLMISFDIVGVQPMPGPVGLIFAMKARASTQGGTEILFNEADTRFGTNDPTAAGAGYTEDEPLPQADLNAYKAFPGTTTEIGEALGDGSGAEFSEVAFSIDKITVTAKTRALKAEYTRELQQDLMKTRGIDARAELANILATELLSEQNREVIRTIYNNAKPGAENNTTIAGTYDLDTDSNGRWMLERFQGMHFQLEREANAIAKDTRRGPGNFVICSSDIASALSAAKLLDSKGAANVLEATGDTQNTFVGVLNGRFKVFVDPYVPISSTNYFVVGYKGASAWDAGIFYCPYVPLQMMEAVGQNSFQPKIAYKTRYGLVTNPFANPAADGALTWNVNKYYRKVKVTNLQ